MLYFQSTTSLSCLVFLYSLTNDISCFPSTLVGDNFSLCWFEFWHLRASSFWSSGQGVPLVFETECLSSPLLKPQHLVVPQMSVSSKFLKMCGYEEYVNSCAAKVEGRALRTMSSIMGIPNFIFKKTSNIGKMCFELFPFKNVLFLFSNFNNCLLQVTLHTENTHCFTILCVWKYNKMAFKWNKYLKYNWSRRVEGGRSGHIWVVREPVLELIVKPLAFSRQCLYLKSTKLVRKGKEKFNCLRVTLEEWISKFTWIPVTGRYTWVPNNA